MASKNSYAGINAIIAKNIKHHAKSIKRSSAFIHEYIEDIEQDLLLDCLPCLAKYDERSEHYKAYVSQLIQSRAANLRKKYLCKKRAIDFVDSDALGEEDKSFEHNFAARIDVNAAIAKSPSEQQEICKLLMEHNFNISEVSRCTVPKSDGIIKYEKKIPSKEELWDKYYMGAPRQQRRCVEQYKIVKRA